ncbi:hypothetical protein KY361_02565 [Candidatus Woesearchaeota archaeon]|nr:hypothetical protein [Candidatus Woesearchaeota archaeon]
MGKIMTKLSLYHMLKYSEHAVDSTGISIVKFDKPQLEAERLLGMAISDLNNGAFAGYRNGHLQFGKDVPLDELRGMDDQQTWLKQAAERARASLSPDVIGKGGERYRSGLWLRIYDGEKNLDAWAWFYFNENSDYGFTGLGIRRGSSEFSEDRVKGIVSPFIAEGQLDEVVAEIMAKKE